MVRLIDADKLNIYDGSPAYGTCVMGVTEEDIELAPTVDAIPIEFIKSEIARMKEGLNPHHPECAIYAEDLGILIEEWEGSKKEYESD